jgi:CxxC motif-containing protein (DUF1111 family)
VASVLVKSPPGVTKTSADGRTLIRLKPTKFDVILSGIGRNFDGYRSTGIGLNVSQPKNCLAIRPTFELARGGETVKHVLGAALILFSGAAMAQHDPGVRGLPVGAGQAVTGLNAQQQAFFNEAKSRFSKTDGVSDGLGPRFNSDSCLSCHSQPAVGGTSPASNPEIVAAHAAGAQNNIPSFITATGPAREARFKSDGGVHDLFVITGRSDAPGCHIAQPDFSDLDNISFRIPTPVFGLGLIANTPDATLEADAAALSGQRSALLIAGHFAHERGGLEASDFNHSGNDGTITRFGWKAQNKSPTIFAGEAYNVEMGVTNELFPNEREGDPNCQFNTLPEDFTDTGGTQLTTAMSDVTAFGTFMTLLAAPTPDIDTASTMNGRELFNSIGCAACHIAQHTTARSNISGLNRVKFSPYSDFQLHDMGSELADGIAQGEASGREFRTAPLWGIGQRIFFLHDGRTRDLLFAIREHDDPLSEARVVIANFNALTAQQQQDILNFLRAL